MQKIEIVTAFKHVDVTDVHPRDYDPGEWTVVDAPAHDKRECSPRCAEVALAEGWAKEVGKADARPPGSRTGKEKPAASSRPARRSRGSKPSR